MNYKEFKESYEETIKIALSFSEKSRREGLISLEEELYDLKDIIYKKRDVFLYGLRLAIDGIDYKYLEQILSNLVNQEKDEYTRLLKTIKKEAVLSIRRADNPRVMVLLLNSYTDIPLSDPVNQIFYETQKNFKNSKKNSEKDPDELSLDENDADKLELD